VLTYRLQIIPELMSYSRSDSWTLNLEHVALDEVRTRLSDWLLRFTDTYLRLECEPNYQDWDTHLDPVCGMRISGAAAAHVIEHEIAGRSTCSEDCRQRFEANPGSTSLVSRHCRLSQRLTNPPHQKRWRPSGRGRPVSGSLDTRAPARLRASSCARAPPLPCLPLTRPGRLDDHGGC
jgi:YHS domain-containing protein